MFGVGKSEGLSPASGNTFGYFCCLAVAPMMLPYLTNLWSREPYRYFPFCLLAVGWLTYLRWDRRYPAPRGMLSWIAVGFGVALAAFGIILASPWICAVAFVTFAVTLYLAATDFEGRSLVGLALPLLMLIHLPLGYDHLLTIRLQQITSGLSSVLLDVLAIPHAVSNNVIQLATRELFVAEACSGIQSVFTLMFLATLLVSIYRRPIWLAPIYLAIAALLAVAANVLRVTIVAVGDVWFSVDLAEGWQHELVGYTALCIATLFLLSFDHLVTALLHPVDPLVDGENNLLISAWNFIVGDDDRDLSSEGREQATAQDSASGIGAMIWKPMWSRRIFVSVLSVLAVSAIAQAFNLQRPVPMFAGPTEIIYQPNADVFDRPFSSIEVQQHEQTRGGSNPRLGENADIWTCVPHQDRAEIQVVLSQPYSGWHELCICYEVNSWILLNRDIRGGASADDGNGPGEYALARFKNNDGGFAYLIYSAIDTHGKIVPPPPRPGRLGNRFTDYFDDRQQNSTSDVMMMQMFIVDVEKLEAETIRGFASDFVEMRSIIQSGVQQRNPARSGIDKADDRSAGSTAQGG